MIAMVQVGAVIVNCNHTWDQDTNQSLRNDAVASDWHLGVMISIAEEFRPLKLCGIPLG